MAVDLTDPIHVGDMLRVKGHSEDFTVTVHSMQIEHENVEEGKAGESVGIKITQRVHPGDTVYRLVS